MRTLRWLFPTGSESSVDSSAKPNYTSTLVRRILTRSTFAAAAFVVSNSWAQDGPNQAPEFLAPPAETATMPEAIVQQPIYDPNVMPVAAAIPVPGGTLVPVAMDGAPFPVFAPQPIAAPQIPLAAGRSALNQPVGFAAQAGYGASQMPNGVYPAAFLTAAGPNPGIPGQPTSMPMQAGPMAAQPMPMEYGGAEPAYGDGGYGGEQAGGEYGGYVDDGAYYNDGVLANFFRRLLPFAEGGMCAPRHYDIALDGLYWKRDEISRQRDFSYFSVQLPAPRPQDLRLSSDNLDYSERPGARFNAALQVLPGTNLEFTYFGMFSWSDSAQATSATGELFSPYSNFGALVGVGTPFDETDRAQLHRLRVSSSLDNFELMIRKRWAGPNCRLQGSWASGARYLYLVDDLNFYTLGRDVPVGLGVAPAGESSTDVRARNSLVGYQAAVDLWANIVPGVSVGADFKAGIYGNYAKVNTHLVASTTAVGATANLFEVSQNTDVAVIGETNLMFLYRTSPNFTLRGGYSLLYVDGIALAPENFNTNTPFGAGRAVREVNDNGHALFHGGFIGVEWMW